MELAAALVDSAHVMVIDWDATYELSRIVEDEWSLLWWRRPYLLASSIDFDQMTLQTSALHSLKH